MCDSDQMDRLIIPLDRALDIVNRAGRIYVRSCPCRLQAQKCPPESWEVCLLFKGALTDDLRSARVITKEAALAILQKMAQQGAVYNLFYQHQSQTITELCSCCSCCCRPLRRMISLEDYASYPRSGYLAVVDAARCTGCGNCETSCLFGARKCVSDKLLLDEDRCFGCGRCIAACPEQAIRLEQQADRGISIPTYVLEE